MNMINHEIYKDLSSDFDKKFKQYAELLASFIEAEGIRVKPYSSPRLIHFSRLSNEHKHEVLRLLGIYIDVCIQTIKEKDSLLNTAILTWNMLKAFGFVPLNDVIDKIKNEDVVEFYDNQNVQIFRNIHFFKICSYSVEDLLCRQWWELYWRDEQIARQIFEMGTKIFNGEMKATQSVCLPAHILKELDSPLKYEMQLELKYLSPLFKNGITQAALVIESVHLL